MPVYDARAETRSFVSVISNLKDLGPYGREIPADSCAVVGYTANTWTRNDGGLKNVSFNIRWAMLLATPGRK